MNSKIFNYTLSEDTFVFSDNLKAGSPYVAVTPRNHESLFIVTKGALLYEKQGLRQVIKKGQIGYIERGSIDKSSAYLCDEVSYIAVNFCFDRTGASYGKTLPFDILCSQGNMYGYEQMFGNMLSIYLVATPGYMAICNGILLQIIGSLYNEYKTDISHFRKISRIEGAMHYLNDNYDSPDLEIRDLAAAVNMSEKNFRRVFVDVYKKTPYKFMQEFRIKKAEFLLTNTDKSISEIAILCGFCDIYSFSHCFKNHNGISPVKYRTSRF